MSLHYPFSACPEAGVWQLVAPGVFWIRLPLPFQLDHINLWLIEDGEGWTLVDTGFPTDDVQQTWESILARLPGRINRLVVTHFHPDHLGLAQWLMEKTGAVLWMSTGEFLTAHVVWQETAGHGAAFMTEQFRQHGLGAELLEKFATRGSGYRRAVPALPDYYHRLKAGDTLTIGGQVWQVDIGYGHSPEHVALYCEALGVFISGDMLLPRISTNISVFAATPRADALNWYLHSLSDMAARLPAETLVLPSHGLPFMGVAARVAELELHHQERLQVLEDACETPRSAASLLLTLFGRELDMHQTMFAMGEAIAHLNLLEGEGRLRRIVDADGLISFVRVYNTRPL